MELNESDLERLINSMIHKLKGADVKPPRKSSDLEELISGYHKILPRLASGRMKLESLLIELMKRRRLNYHNVSSRVKEPPSLANKLKNPKYNALFDVKDLLGFRVITYFESEVNSVAQLIESEFEIDLGHSVDKRKFAAESSFGYRSLHYVCTLSRERRGLSEYEDLADVPFEIQIRSILQHSWAEIEHDLGYKSSLAVPHPIRRKFARIAGALEGIDEDFNQIKEFVSSYRQTLGDPSSFGPDLEPLDRHSLRTLVETDSLILEIDGQIATRATNGNLVKVTNQDYYEGLLKGLQMFELLHCRDIQKLISLYREEPALMYYAVRLCRKDYTRHGWSLFCAILFLISFKEELEVEKVTALRTFMRAVTGEELSPGEWPGAWSQVFAERRERKRRPLKDQSD